MTSPIVVGVDVAKERLDVAVRPSGETWSEPNDDAGVRALVARLRPLGPTLIVCEATGGFDGRRSRRWPRLVCPCQREPAVSHRLAQHRAA
jgi:hypothetical protein